MIGCSAAPCFASHAQGASGCSERVDGQGGGDRLRIAAMPPIWPRHPAARIWDDASQRRGLRSDWRDQFRLGAGSGNGAALSRRDLAGGRPTRWRISAPWRADNFSPFFLFFFFFSASVDFARVRDAAKGKKDTVTRKSAPHGEEIEEFKKATRVYLHKACQPNSFQKDILRPVCLRRIGRRLLFAMPDLAVEAVSDSSRPRPSTPAPSSMFGWRLGPGGSPDATRFGDTVTCGRRCSQDARQSTRDRAGPRGMGMRRTRNWD